MIGPIVEALQAGVMASELRHVKTEPRWLRPGNVLSIQLVGGCLGFVACFVLSGRSS
jgi:hypothetical protein